MAQLRVMIAVALAAGCTPSDAAPSEAAPPPARAAVVAPKGWAADPALAKAAAAAAGDPKTKIAVTASAAWSDPARGCYALVLDLHGGAAPIDVAADELLAALGTELAGAKLHDVQKPAAAPQGTLALGFAGALYHGKLRAELASTGDVHGLACAWNQREPKACEAACTQWLGSGT